MRKIKEVLRLKWECGLSHRQIAASCKIGSGVVSEYLQRARRAGMGWPLPEELSEVELDRQLFPTPDAIQAGQRPMPAWEQVDHDLRRKGVTRRLLWEEYRDASPNGIGYSHFCALFEEWRSICEPSMHQDHKAGEKLYVDYCGQTMPVANRKTGEMRTAQIFVASLGASSYTFVDATWTQALPDWIGSHVRTFDYLGGVPEIVVPDNLKSGVRSACFYEPDVNPTYLDLSLQYNFAIVPARVRKPRDKAKVENAVQQVERRILAPLRNHTFFELTDLNAAIAEPLDVYNRQLFQGRTSSRQELFEKLDKPALRPLPLQPYQPAIWAKVRVQEDYHVSVEGHWYSVPFRFMKQQVDVRITSSTVEFFQYGGRIASHYRSDEKYGHTTCVEHMPPRHRLWHEWSPQRLVSCGLKSGPSTASVIEQLLSSDLHPQQALRSCLGILNLGKDWDADRLEAACRRALFTQSVTYRNIKAMLQNNMDRMPLPEEPVQTIPIQHTNIRGAGYYDSTYTTQPLPQQQTQPNVQSKGPSDAFAPNA